MSPSNTTNLLMRLSERDIAILESLYEHRLLTSAHIRRLHFASGHATQAAAAGAVGRVLERLEEHNLVARLARRIGGVRAGSSGITWQLGATGERLLRKMHGRTGRRRFLEPSPAFVAHTLATAELAVRIQELRDQGTLDVLSMEPEPRCWRSFTGPLGALEWLKPDLFVAVANSEFEDHWFIEADQGTEHPPVIVRKAKVYQRFAATGAHQARHGLFPAVVWVVPGVKLAKPPFRPPWPQTAPCNQNCSGLSRWTSSPM